MFTLESSLAFTLTGSGKNPELSNYTVAADPGVALDVPTQKNELITAVRITRAVIKRYLVFHNNLADISMPPQVKLVVSRYPKKNPDSSVSCY